MNSDIGLFLLVFSSVCIGWSIAKVSNSSLFKKFRTRAWRKSYMEGIHLLLNEESDKVIENLIQTWDVSNDSFDLHNALANMLRRKGEVDRAIRIHANLVESPKLSKDQLRMATIELACDYLKSGLLDRAERLLINVVNTSKDFEEKALQLLQQVYEREKEWGKAIVIAEQLIPVERVAFKDGILSTGSQKIRIANYYCELATTELESEHFQKAEEHLKSAMTFEARHPRALILLAEVHYRRGADTEARDLLKTLSETDPSLIADSLPLVRKIFNDSRAESAFLSHILENYPSSQIDQEVFELARTADKTHAIQFLAGRVRKRPTLRGLDLLLTEQQGYPVNIDLKIRLFHELVIDILKNKPSYQCKSCGFSGNQMHWQCPQCQAWDSIRLIRGGEGD